MKACTASTVIYRPPINQQSACFRIVFEGLSIQFNFFMVFMKWFYFHINIYLFVVIVAVKSALLLALFAVNWRPIFDFRICTSLAFIADECCNNVAIFARCRFAVGLNILFALFADCAGAALGHLLEFWSAICAFHHWKCTPTFLIMSFVEIIS